jgi:hypothetical protein
MTNEERQALINWLTGQRDACDEIHGDGCNDERCLTSKIALASLEAKKLTTVYHGTRGKQSVIGSEVLPLGATEVYTAPPVAVMHPVELPNCVDDLHGIGPVMSAEAVEKAILAAGGSVKE